MQFFTQLKSTRLPILLTLLTLLIFSCNPSEDSSQTQSDSSNVPELIQRNQKIQVGKEWDFVQNFFVEQREALQKNPNDYEAMLNLAQLYIKEARVTGEHGHYYPAALLMCEQIISSDQKNPDLRFRTLTTKAGVQLSLHDFNSAVETAKEAVQINDKSAQIYGVLVDGYVELGQYDKAVQMADLMMSIKPDLRSYSRVSYIREIHGDVEGAKQAMKMAVDAGYPGYDETAWTMITLGDIYLLYGESDKARSIYEAILQERENYPFAIAAIANTYKIEGDVEKAEKMLNEAIDIIPEVGFYVQLAEIYKEQNRTEEFTKIIAEIKEMLLDDEASGHNMNLEYVHIYKDLLEENDMALSYALKEYEKRPQNIDVNRALASIYLAMGETEKAKEYIVVASKTNSKHPDLELMLTQI